MIKKRFAPLPSVAEMPFISRRRSASAEAFYRDVIGGLTSEPKTLPCKYLYDERGSALFEQICDLTEYYPTRTELEIFRGCLAEIAELVGTGAQVVEYGSGSGIKTRMLLKALDAPTGCAMIEISIAALDASARQLEQNFPNLDIIPICADYTKPVAMPAAASGTRRKVAFFPGSTIGNFAPSQARLFLKHIKETVGRNGALIIGVDLQKERAILKAAYDDEAGVTAKFNLNLLTRINRELDADLPLEKFYHVARYNEVLGRVEMHLVADATMKVHVGDRMIAFTRGESIHTENSYKFTLESFRELAGKSGWNVRKVWLDPERLFSVQYLEVTR